MAGAALILNSQALAWNVPDMNRMIDETNVTVGAGCSGTVISLRGIILTNYHCIDDYIGDWDFDKQIWVSQPKFIEDEQVTTISYSTTILAYEEERDLALLQIMGDKLYSETAAPLLPPKKRILKGETVYAVGNPIGLYSTLTKGIVSEFRRLHGRLSVVQFDAPIWFGSSGGALYNDQGYIIGVVKGLWERQGSFAHAINVREIREFLNENCLASIYDDEADDEKCEREQSERTASN